MYYGTCCGRAPLPFCAFNNVCFVCWLVCSTFWFPSWILRLCSAFHHRRLNWCSSQAPALITAAGLKGLWFRESSLPRVSFLFVASSSCCLLPGALVQINCTFVGFVLHMTRNTFAKLISGSVWETGLKTMQTWVTYLSHRTQIPPCPQRLGLTVL